MSCPRIAARAVACLFFASFVTFASAQQSDMLDMPEMKMSAPKAASKAGPTLADSIWQHTDSGTSIEPTSTPVPMWMSQRGGWMTMLHGNIFIADTQQHADISRGGDKLFSTNWVMPMAMHPLGRNGQITLRAMFSLEPATVTGRFYPELFQQGETAYGKPIVDGQHPHDFFMEIAALYDLRLGEHALLSLYAAPVGDPALGPTAYPHRLSASEDPIAALGHHQQDSSHIAMNVATAGLTYKWVRIEGSGFHGEEPTEARWQPEPSANGHAVDSYSTRVTVSPARNWSGQYSIAHIHAPEQLHPTEDQQRQTASVMYNRPFGARHDTSSMPGMDMATPATGDWSNTFVWGRTKSLADNTIADSYLAESLLKFHTRNYVWTRVESAARTSELVNPSGPELPVGHVQAYTLGYDRDYKVAPHLLAAPGAQFTVYRAPDALVSTYGRTPLGAVLFVRFRIVQ